MHTKSSTDNSGQIDTVQSLSRDVNAFTEGGIRWTIFRHKEKLFESGALFRSGRKILIDRDKYISVMKEGLLE